VLDAENPEGLASWLDLWRRFPDREVFAHPEYVRLYAGPSARPLCAAYRSESLLVLYPFLLRDLSCEPFWSPSVGAAYDIATPYGYGGPFACGDRYSPDAGRFWEEFDGWCARNHVVSEFVRFSLLPERLLPYPGRAWRVADHVVRPLQPDQSQLWMDFAHKVRKNVNRATQSGVSIEIEGADCGDSALDRFLDIYRQTMLRRQAAESYCFPRKIFGDIRANLPENAAYVFAMRNGETVAAELVLVSSRSVYSFLGGTREDAFAWRPNDLLKYEIIRWAKAQGKTEFVLGGGYRPDDGIFQYKLGFAPQGRVPYQQGGRVHDPDRYRMLVERRKTLENARGAAWEPPAAFFPQYRG
jgi:hypothetical protein